MSPLARLVTSLLVLAATVACSGLYSATGLSSTRCPTASHADVLIRATHAGDLELWWRADNVRIGDGSFLLRQLDCTPVEPGVTLQEAYCAGEGYRAAARPGLHAYSFPLDMSAEEVAALEPFFTIRWARGTLPDACRHTPAATAALEARQAEAEQRRLEAARREQQRIEAERREQERLAAIAEAERLRALCDDMAARFEGPAPGEAWDRPTLDGVEHCSQIAWWRAVLEVLDADEGLDDAFWRMVATSSSHDANRWVVQARADDLCQSSALDVLTWAWPDCNVQEREARLRDIVIGRLEAADDLDVTWHADEGLLEVRSSDGSYSVAPLTDFYPEGHGRTDDMFSVSRLHTTNPTRTRLCALAEQVIRRMQGPDDITTNVFQQRVQLTDDAEADCPTRYETNGGYAVAGRATWDGRNVHTGRSSDIYVDFTCYFREVEHALGTVYDYVECDIE